MSERIFGKDAPRHVWQALDRAVTAPTTAEEDHEIHTLRRGGEYQPSEEELLFVRDIVREGQSLEHTTKLRAGPFQSLFEQVMHNLQAQLGEIDLRLTPEHLAPYAYQSLAASQLVSTLDGTTLSRMNSAVQQRKRDLEVVGDQLITAMQDQTLHPDLLDTTPFYPSSDDWKHNQAEKGCSTACFRMIFSAVTGQQAPSQTALSTELHKIHNAWVVHDEVLTNLLKTPSFEQYSQKQVTTIEYVGMDFDHIQKVATMIKQRRPETQVFCIVNFSSAANPIRTWHSGILIGADDHQVAYHDPSDTYSGAYTTADRATFIRRWAKTYNRTKFVVAS